MEYSKKYELEIILLFFNDYKKNKNILFSKDKKIRYKRYKMFINNVI